MCGPCNGHSLLRILPKNSVLSTHLQPVVLLFHCITQPFVVWHEKAQVSILRQNRSLASVLGCWKSRLQTSQQTAQSLGIAVSVFSAVVPQLRWMVWLPVGTTTCSPQSDPIIATRLPLNAILLDAMLLNCIMSSCSVFVLSCCSVAVAVMVCQSVTLIFQQS